MTRCLLKTPRPREQSSASGLQRPYGTAGSGSALRDLRAFAWAVAKRDFLVGCSSSQAISAASALNLLVPGSEIAPLPVP